MGAATTEWLIDQDVSVMGIDQWGWDAPFQRQIAQSKRDDRQDIFWEGHRVGQRKPYWCQEACKNDPRSASNFDPRIASPANVTRAATM